MLAFLDRINRWLRRRPVVTTEQGPVPVEGVQRGAVDHIIVLDGTMSSLHPGAESNAGLAFQLFCEATPGPRRTIYYEPGLQWEGWRRMFDVAQGKGINRQIKRAYGYLASHYRPGDRIFLFGYSRGAYAVRSLAGVIDRVGLLERGCATERNVEFIYRHYRKDPHSVSAKAFAQKYCHPHTPILMVGVWDTVKALGWRLPLLWMLSEKQHAFHTTHLGISIQHGFHALALDETRVVLQPVLWECPSDWLGNVEQIWFRGAHADIGGQLGSFTQARPLANIPLVWMLGKAESCGLMLPEGWCSRFPCDAEAPMVGTWQSWGKVFLLRRKRIVGADRSEQLHPSVPVPAQRGLRALLTSIAALF